MTFIPIGYIERLYLGTPIPKGWIECRGQSLKKKDYPELFSVIGAIYGIDDSDSFKIPNIKEDFIAVIYVGNNCENKNSSNT